MKVTIHRIHQKAEQTTVQGLGQEVPVKFSHLYGVSPCEHLSWESRKGRRHQHKLALVQKPPSCVLLFLPPHPRTTEDVKKHIMTLIHTASAGDYENTFL